MSKDSQVIFTRQVNSGFSYLFDVEVRITPSGTPYIAFGTGMARTPEIAREVARYILEAAEVLEKFEGEGL